jgi:hypothetical protein
VLVRPDGIVGWRAERAHQQDAPLRAHDAILAR